MDKTIEQQRLEFLNDMVAYYSFDSQNRRCISAYGQCRYNPKTLALEKSEGCAIGRKLSKEVSNEMDDIGEDSIDEFMLGGYFREKLSSKAIEELDKLEKLGVDFLGSIQTLHDIDRYWSHHGLSEEGIKKVKEIKGLYITN